MADGFDKKRWSNVVFAGAFAACLMLLFRILAPFLTPVLLGAFLVVLFSPLHRLIAARLPAHRAVSAGLATCAVFLLILIPLAVVGYFVVRELYHVAQTAGEVLAGPGVALALPDWVAKRLGPQLDAVPAQDGSLLWTALGQGAGLASTVLGAGSEVALGLFLMAVSTYYLFLDGRRLLQEAVRLIPLDPRYAETFAREVKDVSRAIVYGSAVTALTQGALGLLGLLVAQVPHALLWGVAMTLTALIPIGGTALVWGPIGLVLLLTGRVGEGIFLLAWGALVVGAVDNFIRPKLCCTGQHPLLVFLSLFGGLAAFGLIGLLIGPLVAALFTSMVHIYRRDFLREPEVAPGRPADAPQAAAPPRPKRVPPEVPLSTLHA